MPASQEEGGRRAVVLDATIFHPQGGGQPADTGVISAAAAARFLVEDVRVKDGVVSADIFTIQELGKRDIMLIFLPFEDNLGLPLRAIRGCCWRRMQSRARRRAECDPGNRRRKAQPELQVWSTHGAVNHS